MKKKILTVLIPVVATTLVILGCGKGKTPTTTTTTTVPSVDPVVNTTVVEEEPTIEDWLDEAAGNEDILLNALGVGGVQDGYSDIYIICEDNDVYVTFQFEQGTITDELLEAGFVETLEENLKQNVTAGICKYDVSVIKSNTGIEPEYYGFIYETYEGMELCEIVFSIDEIKNAQ